MNDKNRREYGSVKVLDPEKVIKLALVVDNWKIPMASKLWEESEKVAADALRHLAFDPKDIFYSCQEPFDGKPMTSLFRYYTPISNRVRKQREQACEESGPA
jgi:hypothetical protein